MNVNSYLTLSLALLGLHVQEAWADVRLPALVGSGMVLQRDVKVDIWGWAEPKEAVRVEFQGRKFNTKANRAGQWSISLGPYAAGGPYVMSVTGKNAITLHDILIGDVWLAAGQSNMEMPLNAGKEWQGGIENAEREIAAAQLPRIRLFTVNKTIAIESRYDVESEGWRAVTPQTVGPFSAVAYFFGRELHQRYGIPIGLIQSVWGGTVAEAWMNEAALRHFPQIPAGQPVFDYLRKRAEWYRRHPEDRGQINGRAIWAEPAFDASGWPTIDVPRPGESCGKEMQGFAGVVWFRRTVEVRGEHAGEDLVLRLGRLMQDDVTYFNGVRVGETRGYQQSRAYPVPGRLVLPGENVLAVRLDGYRTEILACTGMYDGQMAAVIGGTTIPLIGTWSYQSGPDLVDFPAMDAAALAARALPNVPRALFHGMIHPLVPFKIKGAIWYQGEANVDRAAQYRTLFPALIQDWRRQWGYEFPFLFVQLAGFGRNQPEPAEYPWAQLREAQSMTLSLPRTGMATAVDIGDAKDIHPKNKQDVARRLVLAARKIAYGENVVHSGPVYQSMKVEGNQARITFSSLGSGLLIKDKYGHARGFEIAGADGRFRWAQARQDGEAILVFNEAVQQPVAVRYSWSNTPDGNVYNEEGLPAVPFRTDVP